MNSPARKRKWSQKITLLFAVTIFLSGCDWIARIPEVRIIKKDGNMVKVQVEVARNPAERNLGLMYRKSLGKNKGMLFVFDEEKKQTFVMKNTYIPLDMIFISRDMRIEGWVENATPLSQQQYAIDKPSQYVLEVNAFFCKDQGIATGDEIRLKDIENP
jgi:hypothetical protein